jgi:hypothetical protein
MSETSESDQHPAVSALARAAEVWVSTADPRPLERWLERELDGDGIARRLAVADWWACLQSLALAKSGRDGWPRPMNSRILALTGALLRFTNPDGTPALQPAGTDADAATRALLQVSSLYPRSREARVIAWMLRRREPNHAPPPLPAWHSPDQALAVLRASWKRDGDLLAIDQRERSPAARMVLVGLGEPWLGPGWRLTQAGEVATPGRPARWHSDSAADLAEWTYTAGGLRLTRTALLLRGRRMALLAEQVNLGSSKRDQIEVEVGLAEGVRAEPLEGSRGLRLSREGKKAAAQVLPIGLPALAYETDRGRFQPAGSGRLLRLAIAPRGRRCWLPLLVSWDPARHRKRLSWRQLTISEDGRVCAPEVAFAARVSWGRDDTVVIYRSLGPPAHRAFLGHQTDARFLVGRFTGEGVVEPLVTIEADTA